MTSKTISVIRGKSTPEGTPGHLLVVETGFSCDTLELQWKNNESGVSCIIADSYSCDIWFSPHLNRNVLRLEDKHGRQDCLVHNGNFAGEAPGELTQIHGCTETGNGYGYLERPDGSGTQFAILKSGATLDALIENLGAGPHTITYQWGEGCAPDDLSDHQTGSAS